MRKYPVSIQLVINSKSLNSLQQKSQAITRVKQQAQQVFNHYHLTLVQVINLKDGILVVESASAAWANRLKQLKIPLLSKLKAQFPCLTDLEIKINPQLHAIKRSVQNSNYNKPTLSAQAAKYLQQIIQKIS